MSASSPLDSKLSFARQTSTKPAVKNTDAVPVLTDQSGLDVSRLWRKAAADLAAYETVAGSLELRKNNNTVNHHLQLVTSLTCGARDGVAVCCAWLQWAVGGRALWRN